MKQGYHDPWFDSRLTPMEMVAACAIIVVLGMLVLFVLAGLATIVF